MASSEARSLTPTVNLVSPHRVPLLLGISLSSSGLDLAPICDFVAAVDGSIFLGPRVIGGFAKWDVPDLVWVMVASFVRNGSTSVQDKSNFRLLILFEEYFGADKVI
uniref:Uncharacterized protein n=1 Tax=Fagus sylvatica TaxID=28930 RepID=A0A2N9IMH3_FAGSY